MADPAYEKLHTRFRRLSDLDGAAAVLHWDLATMMPAGGAAARGAQLATLKTLHHGLLTAPEVADWLSDAETETDLDADQRANVHEMRRMHSHATALDASLVEALSLAQTACEALWRQARPASDFALVRPALETLLARVREAADAKAAVLGLSPYDALLDAYEPDGRCADIDALFEDLGGFLADFLPQALERQHARGATAAPQGPFPVARQQALAHDLMRRLGFDFAHGRLDISLHPFCGGVADDVRITTRYDEADFRSSLMGVLHETGHALYERGLPAAWRGQPIGEARGMMVHESQSLLIEMQVCRSRPFLEFAAPLMRETFEGEGDAWSVDALYRHYTGVEPGFIRVDADEVTYPAHVILRYELERRMIAGDLRPADLPEAWNEGFAQRLGLQPPDDRLGCLQDIHWYDGAWGYFPTYTLGAMCAAQLFAAAQDAEPGLPEAIGRGDFAPLLGWLRANVHGQGSRFSARDLLIRATGRPLETAAFKAHLQRRYLDG